MDAVVSAGSEARVEHVHDLQYFAPPCPIADAAAQQDIKGKTIWWKKKSRRRKSTVFFPSVKRRTCSMAIYAARENGRLLEDLSLHSEPKPNNFCCTLGQEGDFTRPTSPRAPSIDGAAGRHACYSPPGAMAARRKLPVCDVSASGYMLENTPAPNQYSKSESESEDSTRSRALIVWHECYHLVRP